MNMLVALVRIQLVGLFLTLLIPLAALSEGAVRRLDCSIVRTCDAAGSCRDSSGEVSFRMEPIELEANGRGRYSISYQETQAEMTAMSELGPFLWTIGQDRHALIVSSESDWLWHELKPDPAPEATIRFLECAFLN